MYGPVARVEPSGYPQRGGLRNFRRQSQKNIFDLKIDPFKVGSPSFPCLPPQGVGGWDRAPLPPAPQKPLVACRGPGPPTGWTRLARRWN